MLACYVNMTKLSRTNLKRILSKESTRTAKKEKENTTFHIIRYSHQQRIIPKFVPSTMKTNLSLNECLYRGPVTLEHLCGVLLRFQMKRTGIIADIENEFLQVALQPKERDITRFLWLKDIKQPVSPDNLVTYLSIHKSTIWNHFEPFLARCNNQASPSITIIGFNLKIIG